MGTWTKGWTQSEGHISSLWSPKEPSIERTLKKVPIRRSLGSAAMSTGQKVVPSYVQTCIFISWEKLGSRGVLVEILFRDRGCLNVQETVLILYFLFDGSLSFRTRTSRQKKKAKERRKEVEHEKKKYIGKKKSTGLIWTHRKIKRNSKATPKKKTQQWHSLD